MILGEVGQEDVGHASTHVPLGQRPGVGTHLRWCTCRPYPVNALSTWWLAAAVVNPGLWAGIIFGGFLELAAQVILDPNGPTIDNFLTVTGSY